ncbi:WD40-repeat-containing domain protein, partial [Corynascus similis CBS 632.67]
MLLCGIIDELKTTAPTAIISFFFCQATDARINNAIAVLRGLIYMLVTQEPALISHLRKSYDAFGKQRFEGPNSWVALSKILNSILEDLENAHSRKTYLIIDALDECTKDPDKLLGLVVQKSSAFSSVKWIVSSRNSPSIEKDIDTATQKVGLSLELNEESVSAAVTTYIRFKVDWLAKRNKYDNNTRVAVERYLLANANGTFLWVSLVCQELAKTSRRKTQKKLAEIPPGLDAFYRRMMDQIFNLEDTEDTTLCQHILAIISVVYRPIMLDELAALVDTLDGVSSDCEDLEELVALCGSFLTLRNRTIFFVHQSAKDFLLKQARDEIFPSGVEDIHYTLFLRSLRAMQETLRRDIYNLDAPGFSIEKVIPPDPDPLARVRYSCVYWVRHLRDCGLEKHGNKDFQDGGSIDNFLREKYLYWLEALSLLRAMPDGIASILELKSLVQAGKSASSFLDLVQDVCRFSLYHKWAIENSPLQVYISALIFSPARSITRNQYENDEPEWITQRPIVADHWSACLSTLEGHRGRVNSVAWSYDATRLASGSNDTNIKIWDPVTGQCVSTLEGHSHQVKSVAWSHDAARLASASYDKTVKIWDPVTGRCLSTLEGHTYYVRSVAWSCDAARLASASYDNTVKIWDPVTGQCVSTLWGHGNYVGCVAWSHDATRLASGSSDNTVKIWDPVTGQCMLTLEGHSNRVSSVAWSRDPARLASGSYDKTIRIWDPVAGRCVLTLEGHRYYIGCVAWSDDTTRLASASYDKTVKIWDPATGQCISTLWGHSYGVNFVTWSYDAARLASASYDKTIKIWDPAIGQYISRLDGSTHHVNSVACSYDTARQESDASDKTVDIQDPATGQCVSTLEGHRYYVNSVAWSDDAARLASASSDRTIKIWDSMTGQCVSTLWGHDGRVNSVAWSRGAVWLASGSSDQTVKMWDPATGYCVSTLEGHSGWVLSVAWSHDAARLASASYDNT